jgi:hypothetical protein
MDKAGLVAIFEQFDIFRSRAGALGGVPSISQGRQGNFQPDICGQENYRAAIIDHRPLDRVNIGTSSQICRR